MNEIQSQVRRDENGESRENGRSFDLRAAVVHFSRIWSKYMDPSTLLHRTIHFHFWDLLWVLVSQKENEILESVCSEEFFFGVL